LLAGAHVREHSDTGKPRRAGLGRGVAFDVWFVLGEFDLDFIVAACRSHAILVKQVETRRMMDGGVPIFVLGTFGLFVLTYKVGQPTRPSLDNTSPQQLGSSSGNLLGACASNHGTVSQAGLQEADSVIYSSLSARVPPLEQRVCSKRDILLYVLRGRPTSSICRCHARKT